ncbi:MAG: hypothetical protein AB4911_00835 [Oscillochloridaceae bacterium umkhey_bin13]
MTALSDTSQFSSPPSPINQVAITTGGLGAAYALSLSILERLLPIKPNWVAAEVVGGVLLVGLPVMLIARNAAQHGTKLDWRTYEQMVMTGFAGAGTPILTWQLIEYAIKPALR